MKLHSTLSSGPATLDILDCFLDDCAALPCLHRHTYLVDDLGILWHVPAFVPERFKIQFYGLSDVPERFLYRFALGIAARQCRNFNPETAFFRCMDYDRVQHSSTPSQEFFKLLL